MLFLGKCGCGPCSPGGGGGPGTTYSTMRVAGGLVGNESVGEFRFTVRRDHVIATDPLTAVALNWSIAPRQYCAGVGMACPHMIPVQSGTLNWAAGEVADKFITVPLTAHGPPMFWTCPGTPGGGELGWLYLQVTSGYAGTESGLGATHRYDVTAVCNHEALNGSDNPFYGVPYRTQYTGIGQAPVIHNFKNLNPAWSASYSTQTLTQLNAAMAVSYKREVVVNAAGVLVSERIFGSRALWNSGGGVTQTVLSETLLEYTRPHGSGTLTQRIELAGPFQPSSQIAAVQNLDRARTEFDDVGGAYQTPCPATIPAYTYPTEPGWDFVQLATSPLQAPFATFNPWTEGNAGYYRWPPDITIPTNEMIWLAAIKVDGRGLLAGSPVPVFMEIRIVTYRFTNVAMTTWVEEHDTGYFDITDTVLWVEPPAFLGFKRITHRQNPTPPTVPAGFYCHPGYVPPP
jgi:hypothetical protein